MDRLRATENAVEQLLQNGFLLTGSRKMAEMYPGVIEVKRSTDYDLYAQSNKSNHEFITNMKFYNKRVNEQYADDQVAGIYTHDDLNIDIILRNNAQKYKRVFESISAFHYIEYLWKSSPKRMLQYESMDPSQAKHHMNVQRIFIRDYFNALFNLDPLDRYAKDYMTPPENDPFNDDYDGSDIPF